MDYKAYFLKRLDVRISKADVEIIVAEIFEFPDSFPALIEVLTQGSERQSIMASWVLTHVVDRDKTLVTPFVSDIVQLLSVTKADGVKRCCLRVLETVEIKEESKGKLIDLCFGFLLSSSAPIAVKAFSMTVIFNCAQDEPEILKELQLVIEEKMLFESSGFNSRAKKIIKKINS